MVNLFEELSDADLTTVVGGRILGVQGELKPGIYSVDAVLTLDANNPLGEGTFLSGATPISPVGIGGNTATGLIVQVTEDGNVVNVNTNL